MKGRVKIVTVAVVLVIVALSMPSLGFSQTSSTGALTGNTMDASRALIPGAEITLTNEATREARSTVSNENGGYSFPQLAPGSYRLEAALAGFKTAVRSGVLVSVTEITRLDVQLEIGSLTETVTVEAAPVMVQQETSALGRVVGQTVVTSLPLVTRNFTQILGLSTGITMDVTNAGELGRGSGGQVVSKTSVNGARTYDNNFQLDGVDANDFEYSDAGLTPGTPVPSPDAIQEFKVQTSQADASFGRNAGANVNIITKSGTNDIHGTAFEFFRNEALNANDFFYNRAGQKKPVVRQNQYGGTVGGPIRRDKLFFFGSYQGTDQINGLGAGKIKAVCNTSVFSPPLTDDRSAAALGALFAGQTGRNGGVAIKADGSNINPVALRLLNLRLPAETNGALETSLGDLQGRFLFPTPQVIDRTQPFARQGFSAFSIPCTFTENQYMVNADYLQTVKSKFAGKYFRAASLSTVSFVNNPGVPGDPFTLPVLYEVASLAHNYVLSSQVFNELRAGYFRSDLRQRSSSPFKWSDVGVTAPGGSILHDLHPGITITGSYSSTYGTTTYLPQKVFVLEDHLSNIRGSHNFRYGAGTSYRQTDINDQHGASSLNFLSFPDFLLGLDAANNGSSFSNVFSSSYAVSTLETAMRLWDGFAYIKDDWKVGQRLTLNLGFRYERMGHASDAMGDDANFDMNRANPSPPPEGTLAGHVVAHNYNFRTPGYVLPAGITRLDRKDNLIIDGKGQNNWAPRVGFAWQMLPNSNRLLLRGGYGMYYTHSTGLHYFYLGAPNRPTLSQTGLSSATATFQNPFAPLPPALQTGDQRKNFVWSQPPYSPTTAQAVSSLSNDFRPGITQQYSLNIQTEFAKDFLFEIGYAGTRGTHLSSGTSANQAALASPSNPIRGVTTNTVANVPLRVRIQGFQPTGIALLDSTGTSWYNSLQTSVTKRMSKGLQLLASYTWSKNLDTDGAKQFRAGRGGTTPGDQNNPKQRYGQGELSRPHRFVLSYVYQFPNLATQNNVLAKLVHDWSISGVTAIQSGSPMSILYTNSTNVTGITDDRAQMAAGCTYTDLVTSGRLQDRLNQYFNSACLTTPVVVGSDGRATAFGNTGVGIVKGPGQYNTDLSVIRKASLGSNESRRLEFRVEFFNLFNTPQFSIPDTNFSSSTFGQISSTSVNPRFVQLALKLSF